MKLVIDISKDRYDEIMAMDWVNCRRYFDEEIRAIHDGKVLPKGHGSIYDENELRKWIIEGHEEGCGYIDERDIVDIPVLIEADKESVE